MTGQTGGRPESGPGERTAGRRGADRRVSGDAEIVPGVALVTGASRGIGAATARLLAQGGWAVAVNYLRGEAEALSVVRDIAPGPTLTDAAAWASAEVRRGWADRAPLRRNALADDVAGAIAFLASDAARFVTGGHLAADGGVVMP